MLALCQYSFTNSHGPACRPCGIPGLLRSRPHGPVWAQPCSQTLQVGRPVVTSRCSCFLFLRVDPAPGHEVEGLVCDTLFLPPAQNQSRSETKQTGGGWGWGGLALPELLHTVYSPHLWSRTCQPFLYAPYHLAASREP